MHRWDMHEGDELAPDLYALKLLGGGRRYEAYLCWAEDLRTPVVAKVLRPGLVADAAALEGLRGEAAMLRRLEHPLLPRAFGAVLDGPRPHLVLEFVEGPRLSTLIRRYGVSLEQLLPLALNVCAVLHYLARARVVHLDVKPRNIIMAADPRLIDLSIARPVEALGTGHGPLGTDRYMAPEQCDPARFGELGPPADVWGLGVTLQEALTGRAAFAEDGTRFPQLQAAPGPLPDGLPAVLSDAVRACLDPRPGSRPTAGELAAVLEPLVDAVPAPRLGRFRPSPKRRRSIHQEVHA